MTASLNLFGDPVPLKLPLPHDTRTALQERGITAPEFVLLLLRQATPREVQWLATTKLMPPQTDADAQTWLETLVIKRAAPGTDLRVVHELVRDMTPTGIALLEFAFVEGRAPIPKEQGLIAQRMAQELAALRPGQKRSSPGSTDSTKTA